MKFIWKLIEILHKLMLSKKLVYNNFLGVIKLNLWQIQLQLFAKIWKIL